MTAFVVHIGRARLRVPSGWDRWCFEGLTWTLTEDGSVCWLTAKGSRAVGGTVEDRDADS
jgi:hypothetical protein